MDSNDIHSISHSYWSGRADDFSELRMAEYDTPMHKNLLAFIRNILPLRENIKALDVGCGAGFLTLLLLELGCETISIDFSHDMLKKAESNCHDKGFDHGFTLFEMDAQNMSFNDNSFDFIVTRNVTWTLPDARQAYREMFRVLNPGGVLLNIDANYGKTFNEADARGETPKHPTQTLEQLRIRNSISRDLDVTKADRPSWDMAILWEEGAEEVRCIRDIEHKLRISDYNQISVTASKNLRSSLFAVIAVK